MKWTFGRWCVAVLLSAAAVAVLLMPGDDDSNVFSTWWDAQAHGGARGWRAKRFARQIVEGKLRIAYDAALDLEAAHKAVASLPRPGAGELLVLGGAPDVPQPTLDALRALVVRQRQVHGVTGGKTPIAVVVISDSVARYTPFPTPDSVVRPFTSTRLIPPADWTGGRCVVVMHSPKAALASLPRAERIAQPTYFVSPGINLIDGCTIYDAFGSPGAGITAWLSETQFDHARNLFADVPDSTSAIFGGWTGGATDACRSGRPAACRLLLHQGDVRPWPDNLDGFGVQVASVPILRTRLMQQQRWSTPLDGLLHDLGRERFEQLWKSARPIDDAYASIAGEPTTAGLHRWVVRIYGPYHAGPIPAPRSLALTVMALVALALAAVTIPRRRNFA